MATKREKPTADLQHLTNALVDRMVCEIVTASDENEYEALMRLQAAVSLAVYRNGVHHGQQSLARQFDAAERLHVRAENGPRRRK